MTGCDELLRQSVRVLDDAVVHQTDRSGAIPVGVCVALRYCPMGGPSGVTDSHSIELRAGPVAHQLVESAHPTDCSQPHYVPGAGLQRNTHGVVTTVFESTERDAQVIERRPLCAASDYAAHCCFPWFALAPVNS